MESRKTNICKFLPPYVIQVQNESNEWQDYELFGSCIKSTDRSVVVIRSLVPNSNYIDILKDSEFNPFSVGATYMISDEMEVLLSKHNNIIFHCQDANSNIFEKELTLSYVDSQNLLSWVKIDKYSIDGFTKLKGKIPPNSQIQFQLYDRALIQNKDSTFIYRLSEEEMQLSEKRKKLTEFIGTDSFDALDFEQKDLLQEQAMLMKKYNDVLKKRLELLNK